MKTIRPFYLNANHISCILVLFLLCAKQSALAQSCPGNLLTNPGFENNLNNWSNWGGLSESANSNSGTNAAYIASGIASGGGNAASATQGYTYNLNVYSMVSAATNWAVVKIIFYDAAWNTIQQTYVQVTSLNYQQYTVSAVAPYGAAWVTAAMYKDDAGEMWADDFCLSTSGVASTLSLGNLVFYDSNGNGKFDKGDWGIDGEVTVRLYEDNNNDGIADGAAIASTVPSGGGYYTFTGLNPGNYFVQLENIPYWMFLIPKNGGDPDNNIENDNNGISQNMSDNTIKGGTINLSTGNEPGVNSNSSYDFAVSKFNGLGDYVWLDADGNGQQDSGEPGMQNVTVNLINPTDNSILQTTQTDETGYYYFGDPYGWFGITNYTIEFVTPVGYKPTSSNIGSDDSKDSDPIGGKIANISVPVGTFDYSFDAGFVSDNWILPVKLVSFTAILQNENKVNLKWFSENEDNLYNYTIERSIDGKNFRDIGMVLAAGNQNGNADYSFADDIQQLQTSVLYYRLRVVEIDHKITYSDVRVIRKSTAANSLNVTAFPNPVMNQLFITIPAEWQNKNVVYEIVSVTGSLLKRVTRNHASQTETLNVSFFQPGAYVVKINCEGNTVQTKVIKQ